jgi:hypothetical protein
MRKEIETLARWYIPVCIVTSIISILSPTYLKELVMKSRTESIYFVWFPFFIKLADNLVVAIWLYYQGKRDSGRKWIWAFFGFVAHLFAAAFYLGLKIYEERNETFNKRLNPDAE